jgi:hypothetical protein
MGLIIALLGLFAAPAAAAQQDPYSGGTPTTAAPSGVAATIESRPSDGPPGTAVTVRACGYSPGDSVTFTFDGKPVGTGVAGDDGCASATFTVPQVAAGTYQLCAVSAGRAAVCRDFRVLGASTAAGPLARTGVRILLLVVAGLAAIAVGLFLRTSARRRPLVRRT